MVESLLCNTFNSPDSYKDAIPDEVIAMWV
jgi:hypothetical protein